MAFIVYSRCKRKNIKVETLFRISTMLFCIIIQHNDLHYCNDLCKTQIRLRRQKRHPYNKPKRTICMALLVSTQGESDCAFRQWLRFIDSLRYEVFIHLISTSLRIINDNDNNKMSTPGASKLPDATRAPVTPTYHPWRNFDHRHHKVLSH